MFIKPAESGSSVGISRVTDESEIDNAMAFAFAESDCVIVEENLDGREIACGVFNKGDPSFTIMAGRSHSRKLTVLMGRMYCMK